MCYFIQTRCQLFYSIHLILDGTVAGKENKSSYVEMWAINNGKCIYRLFFYQQFIVCLY